MRMKWLEEDNPSRLLFFKEKHGEIICHVPAKEKFFKVCLWMLEKRLREGFYPEPKKLWKKPPTEEKLQELREDKEKVRDEHIRDFMQGEIGSLAIDLHDYQNYCKWYERMKQALEKQDGQMAYECLCDRDKYQYESVEIQHMVVDPDQEEANRKAMEDEAEEETE